MQTKTILSSAAALIASVSAAAVPVNNPNMPTLGGSPWYDWSSSAPGETSTDSWVAAWTETPSASASISAVSSSAVAAVTTSGWASVWTPSPTSQSSWSAVWTPSASSQSSWSAVWTPSPVSQSSWSAVWTPSPVSQSSWSAVWTPAAVSESASSSVPYSNPFTIYTSMTNSWGVITGMPAVVTSQPSQPIPAGWTTTTIATPQYANTTATTVSSATGFQQSTASASIAVHTGAAVASNQLTGASLGLMAVGLVFGLF